LGAIVEIMLGTSARIGEVLALRRRDVDITGAPPTKGSVSANRQPRGLTESICIPRVPDLTQPFRS
jgi:integrase